MNATEVHDAVPAIQSVARAFAVLKLFEPDRPTLNPTQVSAELGMNRTTAWRYLQSLADAGMLEQVGNTPNVRLAPFVMRFSEIFLSPWKRLIEESRPFLGQLRDRTGETAALHMRQGLGRIVVTQVESHHELRRVYHLNGDPIPLHLGAPSTAILASLPVAERTTFLRELNLPLPALSEWETRLHEIRDAGCAVSFGDRTAGSAAVAAPILNVSGTPAGSVAISGPESRLQEPQLSAMRAAVIETAAAITKTLAGVS